MKQHLIKLDSLKKQEDIYAYLNQSFSSTKEKGDILEEYILKLLINAGYDAKRTGGKSDHGIDIEVYEGEKDPSLCIQVKNTSVPLSFDEVRKEFLKTEDKKYKVSKYKIVSLSGFTREARDRFKFGVVSLENAIDYIFELRNMKNKTLDPKTGVKLYPHNQNAYNNAIEILKAENRTCIIYPTGTGKMFILAKFLYKAVKEEKKAIVVAPTNIILDKIKIIFPYLNRKDIEYSTYAGLKNVDSFDYILLDEFHRIGAEEWGKNVKRLLNHNTYAKIIGFSATPERNDGIELVETFFHGNIASQMDIFDAIAAGILKKPIYVSALYSYEEEIELAEEKINSASISEEKKLLSLNKLKSLKLSWNSKNGIKDIFQKYCGGEKKKFICFYESRERLEQNADIMKSYFREAGYRFNKIKGYPVLSHVDYRKDNMANIKLFETEDNDISLLHAVDMFNEGYHVSSLDGVIFLRSTKSNIIYFQQLGRPMHAGGEKTPIIFDFVNNIANSGVESFSSGIKRGTERVNSVLRDLGFNEIDSNIEIVDYTVDFKKEVFDILRGVSRVQEYIDFCEKYGNPPKRSINGSKEERNLAEWKKKHKDKGNFTEEEIKKLEEVDSNFFIKIIIKEKEKRIEEYIKFCKKNGKAPKDNRKLSKEERSLAKWKGRNNKDKENFTEEEIKKLEEVDSNFFIKIKIKRKDERLKDYIEFCKKNGGPPKDNKKLSKEERSLAKWKGRNNKDKENFTEEEIKKLEEVDQDFFLQKIKRKDERLKDYIEFCKKNGGPPKDNKNLSNEERSLVRWKGRNNKDKENFTEEEIKKLEEVDHNFFLQKIKRKDERLKDYIEFCKKNGRSPKESEKVLEKERSLARWRRGNNNKEKIMSNDKNNSIELERLRLENENLRLRLKLEKKVNK